MFNALAGGVGTLGVIATSDGIDRWMLSCYHVLGRPGGAPFADNEVILQPPRGGPGTDVARTDTTRADTVLDCAAALVTAGIPTLAGVLELPPLAASTSPVVGMQVIKSGSETGVTEGVITAVRGDKVTIDQPRGFPRDYDLSQMGDSGALWVERTTFAPVALHTAGNSGGREQAFGVALPAVLASLGLRLL